MEFPKKWSRFLPNRNEELEFSFVTRILQESHQCSSCIARKHWSKRKWKRWALPDAKVWWAIYQSAKAHKSSIFLPSSLILANPRGAISGGTLCHTHALYGKYCKMYRFLKYSFLVLDMIYILLDVTQFFAAFRHTFHISTLESVQKKRSSHWSIFLTCRGSLKEQSRIKLLKVFYS